MPEETSENIHYNTVIVTIREELLCINSGKEPKLELGEKNYY